MCVCVRVCVLYVLGDSIEHDTVTFCNVSVWFNNLCTQPCLSKFFHSNLDDAVWNLQILQHAELLPSLEAGVTSDVPVSRIPFQTVYTVHLRYGTAPNRNIQSMEKYGPNRASTVHRVLPFCRKN